MLHKSIEAEFYSKYYLSEGGRPDLLLMHPKTYYDFGMELNIRSSVCFYNATRGGQPLKFMGVPVLRSLDIRPGSWQVFTSDYTATERLGETTYKISRRITVFEEDCQYLKFGALDYAVYECLENETPEYVVLGSNKPELRTLHLYNRHRY